MNIIFCDKDGTLNGLHRQKEALSHDSSECYDVDERKLEILKRICDATNAKVVFSSSTSAAWNIDEFEELDEMHPTNPYFIKMLEKIRKYDIPFYGITPTIPKWLTPFSYVETWKEYEIQAYLDLHPEVDHICILDDYLQDLESFKEYVVKTEEYNKDNPDLEGLQPHHIDEAVMVMQKKYR